MVNFKKMRQITYIVRQIQHMQMTPYCLTEVPAIQTFISDLKSIPESEFFANSQKCLQSTQIKKRRQSLKILQNLAHGVKFSE